MTPLVRRLAQQQGVDLGSVKGTGVGGRIRKEDVLKAAEAASAPAAAAPAAAAPAPLEVSPLRGTTQPMSRLRKVLAERAVASMQSTAQLTSVVEVDVTKLASFRDSVKADFQAKTGSKLSFLPFFALAAAEALQAYPVINATVDGTDIVYPPTENLSIAVDTERGLLTPVLRDAAGKNLAQIAHEIADLAARTRDNKLKPDEHRCRRQAARHRHGRRQGRDLGALLRVPRPVVRPPCHRRCGCRPVPRRSQEPPRGGSVRVAARLLTHRPMAASRRPARRGAAIRR